MKISQRIYEDYFKKSRLERYREVLVLAREHGYRMLGVLDFYRTVNSSSGIGNVKYLLNRHDIDTSPKVARKLFEIEKDVYGRDGSATYYFRENTIDKKLIHDVESYGYETGYHYEEIASWEKKNKTKSAESFRKNLPEIQNIFLNNLSSFRERTGSRSLSAASHGDFINSRYDFQNYEILRNEKVREKAGIILEAYDDAIMRYVMERYADQILLDDFAENVEKSIRSGCQCIMLLTHPRNWEVDFAANTADNVKRAWQGILYRL